jgi:glycosyltransferase involved in cell wall biosynthesis
MAVKILLIGKQGISLTGAGTYDGLLYRELCKRHEVTLYDKGQELQGEWDIAHCSDLKHLTFSVARRLRCPLVVDIHDYYWISYYHFLCLDFPLRFILQRLRRVKYRLMFRYIDGIILHGQYLYDRIEHRSRYLNFYFGLEHYARARRLWEEKENLILFVGGDFFRKGLPRLLRALPLVLKKVPDARLMVIGKDYWYARAFARLLSSDLPVEFVNGMPREEVYRTYARGKVLVLPSEIEATPLVLSEATMAGIPTIASDAGGHPELIHDGETGYIFPLADTQQLADRIVTCLTDRETSERLVRGGQEFFTRFTIERMMDRLDEIYTDMIETSKKNRNSDLERI